MLPVGVDICRWPYFSLDNVDNVVSPRGEASVPVPPSRSRPRIPRRALASALVAVLAAAGAVAIWSAPAHAAVLPLTQYVNPFIGTDDSNSPNPVPRRRRRQHRPRPGAALRHGAVQPGHADRVAVGLPVQRHPDPGVQPHPLQRCGLLEQRGPRHSCRSPATSAPRPAPAGPATRPPRPRASEVAQAGYYKAVLEQLRQHAGRAVAPPSAPAIMRLTYPSSTTAKVLINTSRSATGNRSGSISISGADGHRHRSPAAASAARPRRTRSSSAIEFDRAPSSVGTWHGGTVSNGSTSTSGVNSGGWLNFDTTTQRRRPGQGRHLVRQPGQRAGQPQRRAVRLRLRHRAHQRRHRLEHDAQPGPGHRRIRHRTCRSSTPRSTTCCINPNIASDVNGQYRGFDNAIHTATHTVYQNYSGLGHLPLLGGADRAHRAERGGRHRQVDGARRPAGRPAAQVVAQPQRGTSS